jgi:hypothetical protein
MELFRGEASDNLDFTLDRFFPVSIPHLSAFFLPLL